jgi:molybdate transport system substrate-binding protein
VPDPRTWRRAARRLGAPAAVALLAVVTGCSSAPATGSAAAGGGSSGTVTVFAAASLTETFTTLARQFEAAHPGSRVKLNFGASSSLALQIEQGARADVFAPASTANMSQLVRAGEVSIPNDFASNSLEIAVPPDNPAGIAILADLARAGVKLALCQPQVPCGAAAAQVFRKAGLSVEPVTLESDVKATLTKVRTGEVDAGLVYVSDVRSAGVKVRGIPIPAALNVAVQYPIAVVSTSPNAAGARAFSDYVRSAAGQQVLAGAGFGPP